MDEQNSKQKRCYFWRIYRYSVPVEQITLKGWIDWCNELYEIQNGRKRTSRIFIDSGMTVATVKGRVWNRDRIEKWLNDHGYSWTLETETRYQFDTTGMDNIVYVDSDEGILRRQRTGA